jgi:aryl-alcohol dehydrogenase-like predicted oxidoreductase
MEHRYLGRSGLRVSEIAYGNWLTHGSQVEEDAARACVAAALDEGITTFDTADAYAGTKAEEVLGRALHGVRRQQLRAVPQARHGIGACVPAAAADRLRRSVPGPSL